MRVPAIVVFTFAATMILNVEEPNYATSSNFVIRLLKLTCCLLLIVACEATPTRSELAPRRAQTAHISNHGSNTGVWTVVIRTLLIPIPIARSRFETSLEFRATG